MEPYPHQFATALFSFLYHLASYDAGGEALVSCGMMEALLKVWPDPINTELPSIGSPPTPLHTYKGHDRISFIGQVCLFMCTHKECY